MYILVLMVIMAVVCIVLMKKVDQRRWHLYQIERDLYFRNHPYQLKSEQDFNVHISMTKPAQFKLMNELMLKSSDHQVYKKATIQRDADLQQKQFAVKVMVEDITIGHLEQKYAEAFCKSLEKTDFFIGRPISILSEVNLCRNTFGEFGCRVKLSLPQDPKMTKDLLLETTTHEVFSDQEWSQAS